MKRYDGKNLTIPENANVQVGDRNVQIGNVTSLNNILIVPSQTPSQNNNTLFNGSLNDEHYHLFVLEDALLGRFVIPNELALTESIAAPIKKKYSCLSQEAIDEIKTFPAIFATKNYHYGKTDADHIAHLGIVTDIAIQNNGIRICASYFFGISQQKLNECRKSLAIEGTPFFNELNRTHWTIKKINLIKVLGEEQLLPFS